MPRSLSLFSAFRCLHTLALILLVACSHETPPAPHQASNHDTITISDAWVNQPPPGADVAGAYLRLHNPGVRADRLLNIETNAAQRVEIHEMQTSDGMMQMREIEGGLALPASKTTELVPGSLHLMLIMPSQELAAGNEITMNLTFERAPAQTVTFQVRSLMDTENAIHAPTHVGHH